MRGELLDGRDELIEDCLDATSTSCDSTPSPAINPWILVFLILSFGNNGLSFAMGVGIMTDTKKELIVRKRVIEYDMPDELSYTLDHFQQGEGDEENGGRPDLSRGPSQSVQFAFEESEEDGESTLSGEKKKKMSVVLDEDGNIIDFVEEELKTEDEDIEGRRVRTYSTDLVRSRPGSERVFDLTGGGGSDFDDDVEIGDMSEESYQSDDTEPTPKPKPETSFRMSRESSFKGPLGSNFQTLSVETNVPNSTIARALRKQKGPAVKEMGF